MTIEIGNSDVCEITKESEDLFILKMSASAPLSLNRGSTEQLMYQIHSSLLQNWVRRGNAAVQKSTHIEVGIWKDNWSVPIDKAGDLYSRIATCLRR